MPPRIWGDHKVAPTKIIAAGATLVVAVLPADATTRFKPTEIRSKNDVGAARRRLNLDKNDKHRVFGNGRELEER